LVKFGGTTYDEALDGKRLTGQLEAVKEALLRAGARNRWLTLREMEELFEGRYPQASISARLRDLRKPSFGGYVVERRRRLDAERGIFEYLVSKRKADVRQEVLQF
jgi:hypothetical protein